LDQLAEMSSSSTMNLLEGVVALDDIMNDVDLLNCLLLDMENSKLPSFSASECCRAVHILTKLRNSVLDICGTSKVGVDDLSGTKKAPEIEKVVDATSIKDKNNVSDEEGKSQNDDYELENTLRRASNLLTHCNNALSTLAEKITNEVPRLAASQMRKILQAYHIMPFQADEMINSMEAEVKHRISALSATSESSSQGNNNIQLLIRHAADQFVDAASVLSELNVKELDPSSKKRIEINNQPTEKIEKNQQESESFSFTKELPSVLGHMNRAIAAVCEAATRLERVQRGALLSTESSLRNVEDGAAFELGRCQGLIDLYRLLEFESGTRRQRFTGEKKKNLGKRILSRLFE